MAHVQEDTKKLPTDPTALRLRFDGPARAEHRLVLAHGAGAPMDSPFLETMALELAERGIRVVRFEFPYMRARRIGKRPPPNRAAVLQETWREVLAKLGSPEGLILGGKSLGGRMASLIADRCGVAGCVCLGYPFHPPAKPDKLRTAHLETLMTPTLIVQGERDPFGPRAEVTGFRLSSSIEFVWLPDGDHSFRPRKRSGITEADNLRAAVQAVASFIQRG